MKQLLNSKFQVKPLSLFEEIRLTEEKKNQAQNFLNEIFGHLEVVCLYSPFNSEFYHSSNTKMDLDEFDNYD